MKIVFCPNPACRRGVVWTGDGRPGLPIGKCPDCGRTTRLARSPRRPEAGGADTLAEEITA